MQKSEEEFLNYVENVLKSDVSNLEIKRKSGRNWQIIITIVFIVVFGAWIGTSYYPMFFGEFTNELTDPENYNPNKFSEKIIYVFLGICVFLYAIYYPWLQMSKGAENLQKFFEDFKIKIIGGIVKFINPNFEYFPNKGANLKEIFSSGILNLEKGFSSKGSDLVKGNILDVNFLFSDIHLAPSGAFADKENYYQKVETIFKGQFFMAEFPKSFKNSVLILPNSENKLFATKFRKNLKEDFGEKVELEDFEFMEKFSVYSSDQIEARYILSTSLMERIKKLNDKNNSPIYFHFYKNSVYIFIQTHTESFEPSLMKSLERKEILIGYFEKLKNLSGIVEDLNLNLKIWK